MTVHYSLFAYDADSFATYNCALKNNYFAVINI